MIHVNYFIRNKSVICIAYRNDNITRIILDRWIIIQYIGQFTQDNTCDLFLEQIVCIDLKIFVDCQVYIIPRFWVSPAYCLDYFAQIVHIKCRFAFHSLERTVKCLFDTRFSNKV